MTFKIQKLAGRMKNNKWNMLLCNCIDFKSAFFRKHFMASHLSLSDLLSRYNPANPLRSSQNNLLTNYVMVRQFRDLFFVHLFPMATGFQFHDFFSFIYYLYSYSFLFPFIYVVCIHCFFYEFQSCLINPTIILFYFILLSFLKFIYLNGLHGLLYFFLDFITSSMTDSVAFYIGKLNQKKVH